MQPLLIVSNLNFQVLLRATYRNMELARQRSPKPPCQPIRNFNLDEAPQGSPLQMQFL
jgi:hypothetical protein